MSLSHDDKKYIAEAVTTAVCDNNDLLIEALAEYLRQQGSEDINSKSDEKGLDSVSR